MVSLAELREKYEDFLLDIEDKGFPSPGLVVPALAILILVAIAFLALPYISKPAEQLRDVQVLVQNAGGDKVSGATATLLAPDGSTAALATTDSSGIAVFKSVPPKEGFRVRVEASDYKAGEAALAAVSSVASLTLESTAPAVPPVTRVLFAVTDDGGQAVSGASLRLVFPGIPERSAVTDAFGQAEIPLQGIPGAANALVAAQGFDDGSRVGISAMELNNSLFAPITITLRRKAQTIAEKGVLQVSVLGPTAAPLDGIIVSLTDVVTGASLREAAALGGKAIFDNLAIGTRFSLRARDPKGIYEPATPAGDYSFASTAQEITLVLKRKSADKPNSILFTVKDKRGQPVTGAEINVFIQNSNRLVAEGVTVDDNGAATIDVLPGETFYATVYADGMLPAFKAGLKGGTAQEFALEQIAEGNNVQATIKVSQDGAPSAGAKVALFTRGGNRDGFFLGVPVITTGPDGIASARIPRKLDGADYRFFAYASKGDITGSSDTVAAIADAVLQVNLQAAPAYLQAKVLDRITARPISGAYVSAQALNAQQIACSTGTNGTCMLTIDAGKDYVLTFSAPGYVDYTTTPLRYAPQAREGYAAKLYSFSALSDVSLDFLGLFDDAGRKVAEIENAQEYTAKFAFTTPNSELAGFYMRVGKALSAAEDFVAIKSFDFGPDATSLYGNALSQTIGCDVPVTSSFDSTTGSLLKWSEGTFTRGFAGSREITLKVRVAEKVRQGDKLEINYRAFAVSNFTPKLNPLDKVVMEKLVSKTGRQPPELPTREDFCGAALSKTEIPISSQTLSCDSQNVCTRFNFYDSATGQRQGSGFSLPLGGQIQVEYALVHPEGIESLGVLSSYVKVVSTQANASRAANVLSFQAATTQSQENVLPVRADPGQKISGTITLQAIKPATKAPVDFTVHSQKIDSAPARTTLVLRITGTNKFSVKTSPTALTAGVQDKVTLTVKDASGNAVTDALVSFFDCTGSSLADQETNVAGDGSRDNGRNGQYAAKLTPSALGKIGIRVEQPDFTAFEECKIAVLPGQYLKAEPDALAFEGNSTPKQSKKITIISTQDLESKVETVARCADASGTSLSTTMLSIQPSSFTLTASKEVTVSLLEGASANTNCMVAFNARTGTTGTYLEVPVSLNVKYPVPPTAPPYPAIVSQVTMRVDDSGITQGYYDASSFGEVTGCRVVPTGANPIAQDAVRVSCSDKVLTISTEYDFSAQGACIAADGETGKILVSRTIQGFPVPDVAIGLSVKPAKGSIKICITPTPTPSVTPTPTPTPTPTTPPEHCANGKQDSTETGIDCGGADCTTCSTAANCYNGIKDAGEQGKDCGGVCTRQCTDTELCSNGVKDGNEEGVDCGGRCTSCGGQAYPRIPSTIELRLDQFAFAESYYSMDTVSGKVTGCDLRSLDSTDKSPVNFVTVDSQQCTAKVLHLVADYTTFPIPPGLYRNLTQTMSLIIKRDGQVSETRLVIVTARYMTGIPANPPYCGDSSCDTTMSENVQSCPADCGTNATCGDGIRNGNEEGIDCGGSCSTNCTASDFTPLPGAINLLLNDEAFARETYSLSNLQSCTPVLCDVRPSYADKNASASIISFVTADADQCTKGVAQVTADYSTYPYLYKGFRQGGTFYVLCENGMVYTRPLRVSAEKMSNIPAILPTCTDGIKNQDETKIDCGGTCSACTGSPSCSNEIKDGNETGIDCGGACTSTCSEDQYEVLPDQINLELDSSAFAEAYYSTKLVPGNVTGCTEVRQNKVGDADTDMKNFVNVTCEDGVFHIIADYARFPDLYRSLVQAGTTKVQRKPASGNGTYAPKTVRIIVSATGVTGAPDKPAPDGCDTLPQTITLVVLPGSGAQLYATGQNNSPNSKTFKIQFKRDPICTIEGFGQGIAGIPGLNVNGIVPQNANTGLDPTSYFPGGAYSNAQTLNYPSGTSPECQYPNVLYAPQLCPACQGIMGVDYANPANSQTPSALQTTATGYMPRITPTPAPKASVTPTPSASPTASPTPKATARGLSTVSLQSTFPTTFGNQQYGSAYPQYGSTTTPAYGQSSYTLAQPNYGPVSYGNQYNPLGVGAYGQNQPLYGSTMQQYGSPYGTSYVPTSAYGQPANGYNGFSSFGLGNNYGQQGSYGQNGLYGSTTGMNNYGQQGLGGFPGSSGQTGYPSMNGNGNSMPMSGCSTPTVCYNPSACQLSQCSSAPFGGSGGGQLRPTVQCTKDALTASASYQGITPTGPYVQKGRISVTAMNANGTPACTKQITLSVYVAGYASSSGGMSPSTSVLYCGSGFPGGMPMGGQGMPNNGQGGPSGGGQPQPILQQPDMANLLDEMRMPRSITVEINPLTLRGTYRTSVPTMLPASFSDLLPSSRPPGGVGAGFPNGITPGGSQTGYPTTIPTVRPGTSVPIAPRTPFVRQQAAGTLSFQSYPTGLQPTGAFNQQPVGAITPTNPLQPGNALPFLCDRSSLQFSLPSGTQVSNQEICSPDGKIEITLDFSSSSVAGAWYGHPEAISATGYIQVSLTAVGSNMQKSIPVTIKADSFKPAGIQLLFWRPQARPAELQQAQDTPAEPTATSKMPYNYPIEVKPLPRLPGQIGAGTSSAPGYGPDSSEDYATPQKSQNFEEAENFDKIERGSELGDGIATSVAISTTQLQLDGVPGIKPIAVGSTLQFTGKVKGLANLGAIDGRLKVSQGSKVSELKVKAASIPDVITIQLDKTGKASRNFYFLGRGRTKDGIEPLVGCTLDPEQDTEMLGQAGDEPLNEVVAGKTVLTGTRKTTTTKPLSSILNTIPSAPRAMQTPIGKISLAGTPIINADLLPPALFRPAVGGSAAISLVQGADGSMSYPEDQIGRIAIAGNFPEFAGMPVERYDITPSNGPIRKPIYTSIKDGEEVDEGFCDQSGIGIKADYSGLIVQGEVKKKNVDDALTVYERLCVRQASGYDYSYDEDVCDLRNQLRACSKTGIITDACRETSRTAIIRHLKQRGVLTIEIGDSNNVWSKRTVSIPVFIRGPFAQYADEEHDTQSAQAAKAGTFLMEITSSDASNNQIVKVDDTSLQSETSVLNVRPNAPITIKVWPPAGDTPNQRVLYVSTNSVLGSAPAVTGMVTTPVDVPIDTTSTPTTSTTTTTPGIGSNGMPIRAAPLQTISLAGKTIAQMKTEVINQLETNYFFTGPAADVQSARSYLKTTAPALSTINDDWNSLDDTAYAQKVQDTISLLITQTQTASPTVRITAMGTAPVSTTGATTPTGTTPATTPTINTAGEQNKELDFTQAFRQSGKGAFERSFRITRKGDFYLLGKTVVKDQAKYVRVKIHVDDGFNLQLKTDYYEGDVITFPNANWPQGDTAYVKDDASQRKFFLAYYKNNEITPLPGAYVQTTSDLIPVTTYNAIVPYLPDSTDGKVAIFAVARTEGKDTRTNVLVKLEAISNPFIVKTRPGVSRSQKAAPIIGTSATFGGEPKLPEVTPGEKVTIKVIDAAFGEIDPSTQKVYFVKTSDGKAYGGWKAVETKPGTTPGTVDWTPSQLDCKQVAYTQNGAATNTGHAECSGDAPKDAGDYSIALYPNNNDIPPSGLAKFRVKAGATPARPATKSRSTNGPLPSGTDSTKPVATSANGYISGVKTRMMLETKGEQFLYETKKLFPGGSKIFEVEINKEKLEELKGSKLSVLLLKSSGVALAAAQEVKVAENPLIPFSFTDSFDLGTDNNIQVTLKDKNDKVITAYTGPAFEVVSLTTSAALSCVKKSEMPKKYLGLAILLATTDYQKSFINLGCEGADYSLSAQDRQGMFDWTSNPTLFFVSTGSTISRGITLNNAFTNFKNAGVSEFKAKQVLESNYNGALTYFIQFEIG